MAMYSVYLPPQGRAVSDEDGFRLVQDGKTPWALIAPLVWLIWHRLWLPLLAYVLVIWAILLLAYWQPGAAVLYLSALPGLYLLLEGSELIRNRYERLGWRFAGVVEGENVEEAELRFLVGYEGQLPDISVQTSTALQATLYKSAPATGLFPE